METSSPAEHKATVPTGEAGVGFTPGPWLLDGTCVYFLDWDGESYEGRGKDYRRQLSNRFWCSVQGTPRRIPEAELIANARLIAAAPELYEALRDFFENPDFVCTVGGNPIRVQAMMARGIAALKKARGEQPEQVAWGVS